jgi:Pyruvate/2-oxoacid:ferredoxin oxidoreductase delta subunit
VRIRAGPRAALCKSYGVCPDNTVLKLGPGKRFEFNYDYCKGCGICVSECPCGASKMVPETV